MAIALHQFHRRYGAKSGLAYVEEQSSHSCQSPLFEFAKPWLYPPRSFNLQDMMQPVNDATTLGYAYLSPFLQFYPPSPHFSTPQSISPSPLRTIDKIMANVFFASSETSLISFPPTATSPSTLQPQQSLAQTSLSPHFTISNLTKHRSPPAASSPTPPSPRSRAPHSPSFLAIPASTTASYSHLGLARRITGMASLLPSPSIPAGWS